MNNVIKQSEVQVVPVRCHTDQMEHQMQTLVKEQYLSALRDSVCCMFRKAEYDEHGKQALATFTISMDGGPNVWVHFAQEDGAAEPNFEALRHGAVLRTGEGLGQWLRFIDGLGFRKSDYNR